jgi:hypothetical protein
MCELVTSLQRRPTTYICLKVFLDVGVMVICSAYIELCRRMSQIPEDQESFQGLLFKNLIFLLLPAVLVAG